MAEHPESGKQGKSADDAWPEKVDPWEAVDREWESWWDEWEEEPSSPHKNAPEQGERAGVEQRVPDRGDGSPSAVEAYAEGMRAAGPYLGLGFQIAGTMALFVAGGYFLDRWLDSSPWGILGGAVVAFAAILMLVIRLARKPSP